MPSLEYMKQNNINEYNAQVSADYCAKILEIPYNTKISFERLITNMDEDKFVNFAENIRKRFLANIFVELKSFEFLVTEVLNNIHDHPKFQKTHAYAQ